MKKVLTDILKYTLNYILVFMCLVWYGRFLKYRLPEYYKVELNPLKIWRYIIVITLLIFALWGFIWFLDTVWKPIVDFINYVRWGIK